MPDQPANPAADLQQQAVEAAKASMDSDVRLLVLASNTTLDEFQARFPGILDALAQRAVGATFRVLQPLLQTAAEDRATIERREAARESYRVAVENARRDGPGGTDG